MKRGLLVSLLLIIAVFSFGATLSAGISYDPSGFNLPLHSGIGVSVSLDRGEGATYYRGEELKITFRADINSYITILNIQSDGRIKVLFPNKYVSNNYVAGGVNYSLPTSNASLDYGITASSDRGKEIIYVVASDSPLGFVNSLGFSDVFPFPYLSFTVNNFSASLSFGFGSVWGADSTYFYSNYSPVLVSTKIDCDRQRSDVYVDGVYVGSTPLNTRLEAGSHILYIKGKRDLEFGPKIIRISKFDSRFFFNLLPTYPYGYLEVTSSPDGANVSVDGEYVGKTPYRDYEKVGNREVTVSEWAYHSQGADVYINQGETSSYYFNLIPKTEEEVKKDRNILILAGAAFVAIIAIMLLAF